jgi:hypothetical protein
MSPVVAGAVPKWKSGRNDFQGADLSRRLLHGSDLEIDRMVQF